MKKVTTNMSLGQILFVVLTLFASSVMFFYLGAKFGPQILDSTQSRARLKDAFLPDDELASEIKDLLAKAETEFTFFDVVQSKKPFPNVKKSKNHTEYVSLIQDEPNSQKLAAKEPIEEKLKKTESEKPKEKPVEPKKVEPKKKNPPKEKPKAQKIAKKPEAPKKVEKPQEKPKSLASLTKKLEKDPKEEIKEEVQKTRYLLQVGSFSSLKKAEKEQKVWQKRGYSPTVVVAKIPGKGKWYRLRLGLYNDYRDIQKRQRHIMQRYKQTAMILPIQ